MTYRIAEVGPNYSVVELTSATGNARFFKRASWRFDLDAVLDGTLVTCTADFAVRFQYFLVAPILFLMRRAIARDLGQLKRAIEKSGRPWSGTGGRRAGRAKAPVPWLGRYTSRMAIDLVLKGFAATRNQQYRHPSTLSPHEEPRCLRGLGAARGANAYPLAAGLVSLGRSPPVAQGGC